MRAAPPTGADRAAPAPEVPARLPLLGHLVELGRDPDGLMASCRRRYGDAFTLRIPTRRTFLLDPHDHPAFFQCKALSFTDLSLEIGGRVFGYDRRRAGAWGFGDLTGLFSLLKGDELPALTERMHGKLLERLRGAVGAGWTEDGLYRFLGEHVFAAGVEALFGDGFYSEELRRHYEVIDRWFGLLAMGVPAAALPGCRRSRRFLAAAATVDHPGRCRLLLARRDHFLRHRIPAAEWGALDATLIWASQSNTVSAAFWTVLHVLRDPRARSEILAEVREAGPGLLTAEALRRMSKLDSAISEAIRLTSLVMVLRRAESATELTLASGRRLAVRPGDELALYARTTHLDPEIYPAPCTFVFDRFVGDGEAPRFYRGGRRVTFHLLPFGGGASACPGRFFVRNEFKLVVATLLAGFDIELCSAGVPELMLSRVGLGTPPPARDVPFRLRRQGGSLLS